MPLDDRARELLEAPNFICLSTTRPDGDIATVPVWVHTDGKSVEVNSAEGRGWVRNLERDPRITGLVYNMENPYEYVMIRGRVSDRTHEGADDHIDFLAKKYMGVDSYPYRSPTEQRVIFKITPEHVTYRGA